MEAATHRPGRTLNGTWQFQLDPDGALTPATLSPDRTIPVPLPWQVACPELQTYSGYAWYRRSFELAADELAGELLLSFGAVDYWCQVFVNGSLAGEHEGGYTPFTLPIKALARPGENELAVRVYDPTQTGRDIPRWPERVPAETPGGPPFKAEDVPHGKQEWYINIGGIWQDVTLRAVPAVSLETVHVTGDIHSGEARARVWLAGAPAEGTLKLEVAREGKVVAGAELPLVAGQVAYEQTLTIDAPKLWRLDDPALYTLRVALQTPSGADEQVTRFGFREIAISDGRLLLNGEPIMLLGALDQDLYPETIASPPTVDYLREQFIRAKELGLNCLRCHIKPPHPPYLDLADELGLLVWAEIPSWRTFVVKETVHPNMIALGDSVKARVERTLEEMVRRDFNHPSLVIWTLVNEDWGTSLPLSAADRAWVAALYERCKQLDPTRLVVDNSACGHAWGPNIHVRSDIDDYHVYANIPDQAALFAAGIEQFALRPAWTYSQHGDATRTGHEPLILSEFGNWGLPSLKALRDAAGGADPDWFHLGPWWSPWEGEPGWPQGVAERFAALGLTAIWPDYEAFAEATQRHQFAALKYEIETMRRQPGLAGYVITELSDIYWESNGLLDFNRRPKVFHDRFASINAPDVVIPTPERYATWDDQPVEVTVETSRYGEKAWDGAQLAWSLDGGESQLLAAPSVARASVASLGSLSVAPPRVDAARPLTLKLALRDGAGKPIAYNELELLALPAAARSPGLSAAIAADASLAEGLGLAGYSMAAGLAGARLAVTARPTAELLAWVRAGGDLLFLCQGASPFFYAQGRGGAYSGGWISSYSWLRPGVHKRLQPQNPLTMPYRNVMPQHTIVGVPVEDPAVQPDLLAGMVAGWVRHPVAHTVQLRYGNGRVVMTTFALAQQVGRDPVATAMLHDLIDHLASDACDPALRVLM